MEFINSHDITAAEIASAGASASHTRTISVPTGFRAWSLHVAPQNTAGGPPPDPDLTLEYDLDGTFFPTNPATGPIATPLNEVSTINRDDAINRMRLTMDIGIAPIPNGDILVRLYGLR